jgi:hypothetical protein
MWHHTSAVCPVLGNLHPLSASGVVGSASQRGPVGRGTSSCLQILRASP